MAYGMQIQLFGLFYSLIFAALIPLLAGGCGRRTSPAGSFYAITPRDNIADVSCGPETLSVYSKLRNKEHTIEDIYKLVNKRSGQTVSMLELKQAAKSLGFEAEGYLLDPDNLDGIETYAIIPVGENKTGSYSDPLHFVLVRFSKGKIFEIDYNTMEERPLDLTQLKTAWKGPALFLK